MEISFCQLIWLCLFSVCKTKALGSSGAGSGMEGIPGVQAVKDGLVAHSGVRFNFITRFGVALSEDMTLAGGGCVAPFSTPLG